MNITPLESFFNYDGCDEPEKIHQKFQEIISKAPKNTELRVHYYHLYQYQDFWYNPIFLEGAILAQEQFQAQPNNIILCSAPKTGTTWLKALSFALMNRGSIDDLAHPLQVNVPHECVPFLELDLVHKRAKQYPQVPLLATHLPYCLLPKSIKKSKCKLVYICRDPKDVFTSLYHFGEKIRGKEGHVPVEKVFNLFCQWISMYGPYLDHVLGFWRGSLENPERILFLKYEELKKDISFHLRRLAEFIGHPFSLEEEKEGVVEKIAHFCSFQNLSNLEVNKTGKFSVSDPIVILNNFFFRKGEVVGELVLQQK